MCGIYGIVSRRYPRENLLTRLSAMGRAQHHRGPDAQKEICRPLPTGHLGLGLVRLSILDLETGMQPIVCPRDQSVIICNGQIYNYLELKTLVTGVPFVTKGDIEVALHLYHRFGVDFLNHLNGMYAGAIYCPGAQRLLLFRDRFGIKPLYYCRVGGSFFFASEIKALLAGSGQPPRFRHEGLATYFTYRYLPGEKTMFQGIRRLPPGTFLDYDLQSDTCEIKRYWEYVPRPSDSPPSWDEATEQFFDLLSDAVRLRLRADVEVGTLLSGGIDSSAVTALTADRKPAVRLFTMAFEEAKYNEYPQVKRFLAAHPRRFAAVRRNVQTCGRQSLARLPGIVRALEEPISLGTILPTDQVCDLAGQQLKVVLTGEGADEIFAGYRKFLVEAAAALYPDLPFEQQQALLADYPELPGYLAIRSDNPVDRYIQSEQLFEAESLAWLLGRPIESVSFPEEARPRFDGREDALNAAIAMECRARLPDYVILRLDKLSMRHSLETRTPFLDYRLAELAASWPTWMKVDPGRKAAKRVCSQAYARYNVLDPPTAAREKQPFTIPLADWLAAPKELPDFLREILEGDLIHQQGILNPAVARQELQQISTGATGPATLVSPADRVFAIIMFTLWYETFFGKNVTF